MGAHESRELLADISKESQSVVLREGVQEVLDNLVRFTAGHILQFCDDLFFVASREGGGADDGLELGVLVEDIAQASDGLRSLVKARGLD